MNYVVLRTHARIADLLTQEQMQTLADARNVDDFLAKLMDTPYGSVTLDDESRPDIALERVFYRKFIERIEKIVELTPRKIGEFLMGYYQMRFEVVNLKRILRGKFSNASEEEIRLSLIPISPYRVASYEDMVEAGSLEDVVEMLRGTTYAGVEERMPLYEEYDALWPLELMLNYINASAILEAVKQLPTGDRRIVRKLVELETDIENVLIAVKQRGHKHEALNVEELFPATYGVAVSQLEDIIEAENLRPVIQGLGSPYAEILGPIYTGDVALIRTYLRLAKYDHVTASRSADEYGFNVIMAYLVYSEIEKDNLVGLAWGKAQGLLPKELLKYVVIPRG
jgi:V/A-type H+-transporting ATPase subunit C